MSSARPILPQSWNRYSYVLNSPLNLVDPSGFGDEEAQKKKLEEEQQSPPPPPPTPTQEQINQAINVISLTYPSGDTFSYQTTREMREALSAYYIAEFQSAYQEYSDVYIASQLGSIVPQSITDTGGASRTVSDSQNVTVGGSVSSSGPSITGATTATVGTQNTTNAQTAVTSTIRQESRATNMQGALNLSGQFISFSGGLGRGRGTLMNVSGPNGYRAKERLSEGTAVKILQAVGSSARLNAASTFAAAVRARW